jgi:predicted NBD/HSP70 family sugar kinase
MWMERFDLPTFVENEANAAALGEYYFGAARGVNDFIYLSAGIGLGSGIVIDGKLFRGSSGYASEVGHMTIVSDGELCGCGKRGCWETLVGPRAVLRKVRTTLSDNNPSLLNEMVQGDLEAIRLEHVLEAAQLADPVAIRALQEVGRYLGVGVVNLVNIFNPELIVLGGALNLASSTLLPEIYQQVCSDALRPACENLRIAPSAHGMDAALGGAIALVVDDILRDPRTLS